MLDILEEIESKKSGNKGADEEDGKAEKSKGKGDTTKASRKGQERSRPGSPVLNILFSTRMSDRTGEEAEMEGRSQNCQGSTTGSKAFQTRVWGGRVDCG